MKVKMGVIRVFNESDFAGVQFNFDAANSVVVQDIKSVESVKTAINYIVSKVKLCNGVPRFNFHDVVYASDTDNTFKYAKCVIKLSKMAGSDDLRRHSFCVSAENFVSKLVTEIQDWVTNTKRYSMARSNLEELNAAVAGCVAKTDCNFAIRFVPSDLPVKSVSDKEVVFGVDMQHAINVAKLDLFSADENVKSLYEGAVEDSLAGFTPVRYIKSKSILLRDLGALNGFGVKRLIRNNVKYKVQYVTNGLGYIEKDHIFALIECCTCDVDDVDSHMEKLAAKTGNDVCVMESSKDGKKRLLSYVLRPFDESTLISQDISIENILA